MKRFWNVIVPALFLLVLLFSVLAPEDEGCGDACSSGSSEELFNRPTTEWTSEDIIRGFNDPSVNKAKLLQSLASNPALVSGNAEAIAQFLDDGGIPHDGNYEAVSEMVFADRSVDGKRRAERANMAKKSFSKHVKKQHGKKVNVEKAEVQAYDDDSEQIVAAGKKVTLGQVAPSEDVTFTETGVELKQESGQVVAISGEGEAAIERKLDEAGQPTSEFEIREGEQCSQIAVANGEDQPTGCSQANLHEFTFEENNVLDIPEPIGIEIGRGTVRAKGSVRGASQFFDDKSVVTYDSRGGEVLIDKDGSIRADNARVEIAPYDASLTNPIITVDGTFERRGDQVLLDSGSGTKTTLQVSYLDTAYTVSSHGKTAVSLGKVGEAFTGVSNSLSVTRTDAINTLIRGSGQVSIQENIVDGLGRMLAPNDQGIRVEGINGKSSFTFDKKGARMQFELRGQVAYEDNSKRVTTTHDSARAKQPFDPKSRDPTDVVVVECSGCGDSRVAQIEHKIILAQSRGVSTTTEARVLNSEEEILVAQSSGVAISFIVESKGGKLRGLIDPTVDLNGGTPYIERNLIVSAGGNNYGVVASDNGLAAGVFERREGDFVKRVGVEFGAGGLLGKRIVVASESQAQEVLSLLDPRNTQYYDSVNLKTKDDALVQEKLVTMATSPAGVALLRQRGIDADLFAHDSSYRETILRQRSTSRELVALQEKFSTRGIDFNDDGTCANEACSQYVRSIFSSSVNLGQPDAETRDYLALRGKVAEVALASSEQEIREMRDAQGDTENLENEIEVLRVQTKTDRQFSEYASYDAALRGEYTIEQQAILDDAYKLGQERKGIEFELTKTERKIAEIQAIMEKKEKAAYNRAFRAYGGDPKLARLHQDEFLVEEGQETIRFLYGGGGSDTNFGGELSSQCSTYRCFAAQLRALQGVQGGLQKSRDENVRKTESLLADPASTYIVAEMCRQAGAHDCAIEQNTNIVAGLARNGFALSKDAEGQLKGMTALAYVEKAKEAEKEGQKELAKGYYDQATTLVQGLDEGVAGVTYVKRKTHYVANGGDKLAQLAAESDSELAQADFDERYSDMDALSDNSIAGTFVNGFAEMGEKAFDALSVIDFKEGYYALTGEEDRRREEKRKYNTEQAALVKETLRHVQNGGKVEETAAYQKYALVRCQTKGVDCAAADYEKAEQAYLEGDVQVAYPKMLALAKKGNANAQAWLDEHAAGYVGSVLVDGVGFVTDPLEVVTAVKLGNKIVKASDKFAKVSAQVDHFKDLARAAAEAGDTAAAARYAQRAQQAQEQADALFGALEEGERIARLEGANKLEKEVAKLEKQITRDEARLAQLRQKSSLAGCASCVDQVAQADQLRLELEFKRDALDTAKQRVKEIDEQSLVELGLAKVGTPATPAKRVIDAPVEIEDDASEILENSEHRRLSLSRAVEPSQAVRVSTRPSSSYPSFAVVVEPTGRIELVPSSLSSSPVELTTPGAPFDEPKVVARFDRGLSGSLDEVVQTAQGEIPTSLQSSGTNVVVEKTVKHIDQTRFGVVTNNIIRGGEGHVVAGTKDGVAFASRTNGNAVVGLVAVPQGASAEDVRRLREELDDVLEGAGSIDDIATEATRAFCPIPVRVAAGGKAIFVGKAADKCGPSRVAIIEVRDTDLGASPGLDASTPALQAARSVLPATGARVEQVSSSQLRVLSTDSIPGSVPPSTFLPPSTSLSGKTVGFEPRLSVEEQSQAAAIFDDLKKDGGVVVLSGKKLEVSGTSEARIRELRDLLAPQGIDVVPTTSPSRFGRIDTFDNLVLRTGIERGGSLTAENARFVSRLQTPTNTKATISVMMDERGRFLTPEQVAKVGDRQKLVEAKVDFDSATRKFSNVRVTSGGDEVQQAAQNAVDFHNTHVELGSQGTLLPDEDIALRGAEVTGVPESFDSVLKTREMEPIRPGKTVMDGPEQLISIDEIDDFFKTEGKDPENYKALLAEQGFIHTDPETGEKFIRVIRPPTSISKSTPELISQDTGLVSMLNLDRATPIQRADGKWFIAKPDLTVLSGTTRHNAMRLVQEKVYGRRLPEVSVIRGEPGDTPLVLIEMVDGKTIGKEEYQNSLDVIISESGAQAKAPELHRESLFQGVVNIHTGSKDAEQFIIQGENGLERVIRLDDEFGFIDHALASDNPNFRRYAYESYFGEELVTLIEVSGAPNDALTLGVRKQDYYLGGMFLEDKFRQDFNGIIDEILDGVYDPVKSAQYRESLLQAGIGSRDAETIMASLRKGSRAEAQADLEAKIRKVIDCDGRCFTTSDGRILTKDEFVDAMKQRLIQSGISPERIDALKNKPASGLPSSQAPVTRVMDADLPATQVSGSNLPSTQIIDTSANGVVDAERLNPDLVGGSDTVIDAPPDVLPIAVTKPERSQVVVPVDKPVDANKAFFEGDSFRRSLVRESIQPDGTRFVTVRVDAAGKIDPRGVHRVTLRNNVREGTFSAVGVPAELGVDARKVLDDSVGELNKLGLDRDALDSVSPAGSRTTLKEGVLDADGADIIDSQTIPAKRTPPPLPEQARVLDADGAVVVPARVLDEADAARVERNLAQLEAQGAVIKAGEIDGKNALQVDVPTGANRAEIDALIADNQRILGDDVKQVVVTQGGAADVNLVDNGKVVRSSEAVEELGFERGDDLLQELPDEVDAGAAAKVDSEVSSAPVTPDTALDTTSAPVSLPAATLTPNEVTLESLITIAEREARAGNVVAGDLVDSYKAKLAQLKEYEAYQKRGTFSRLIDWANPFHEPPVKPKVVVQSDLERRLLSEANANVNRIGGQKIDPSSQIVPFEGAFDETVALRVSTIRDLEPGKIGEIDPLSLTPEARAFFQENGFTGKVQRLGVTASKDLEDVIGSVLKGTVADDLDLYQAVRMQREDGSWWYVKLALGKTETSESSILEALLANTVLRDGVRRDQSAKVLFNKEFADVGVAVPEIKILDLEDGIKVSVSRELESYTSLGKPSTLEKLRSAIAGKGLSPEEQFALEEALRFNAVFNVWARSTDVELAIARVNGKWKVVRVDDEFMFAGSMVGSKKYVVGHDIGVARSMKDLGGNEFVDIPFRQTHFMRNGAFDDELFERSFRAHINRLDAFAKEDGGAKLKAYLREAGYSDSEADQLVRSIQERDATVLESDLRKLLENNGEMVVDDGSLVTPDEIFGREVRAGTPSEPPVSRATARLDDPATAVREDFAAVCPLPVRSAASQVAVGGQAIAGLAGSTGADCYKIDPASRKTFSQAVATAEGRGIRIEVVGDREVLISGRGFGDDVREVEKALKERGVDVTLFEVDADDLVEASRTNVDDLLARVGVVEELAQPAITAGKIEVDTVLARSLKSMISDLRKQDGAILREGNTIIIQNPRLIGNLPDRPLAGDPSYYLRQIFERHGLTVIVEGPRTLPPVTDVISVMDGLGISVISVPSKIDPAAVQRSLRHLGGDDVFLIHIDLQNEIHIRTMEEIDSLDDGTYIGSRIDKEGRIKPAGTALAKEGGEWVPESRRPQVTERAIQMSGLNRETVLFNDAVESSGTILKAASPPLLPTPFQVLDASSRVGSDLRVELLVGDAGDITVPTSGTSPSGKYVVAQVLDNGRIEVVEVIEYHPGGVIKNADSETDTLARAAISRFNDNLETDIVTMNIPRNKVDQEAFFTRALEIAREKGDAALVHKYEVLLSESQKKKFLGFIGGGKVPSEIVPDNVLDHFIVQKAFADNAAGSFIRKGDVVEVRLHDGTVLHVKSNADPAELERNVQSVLFDNNGASRDDVVAALRSSGCTVNIGGKAIAGRAAEACALVDVQVISLDEIVPRKISPALSGSQNIQGAKPISQLREQYSVDLEKIVAGENLPTVDPSRVKVSGEFGTGTKGVVYEADIEGLGEGLAVKAARADPKRGTLEDNIRELIAEQKIAQEVCKVVPCPANLGVHVIDGVPVSVTEAVRGKNIQDLSDTEIVKFLTPQRMSQLEDDLRLVIGENIIPSDVQVMILSEPQILGGRRYQAGDYVFVDMAQWEEVRYVYDRDTELALASNTLHVALNKAKFKPTRELFNSIQNVDPTLMEPLLVARGLNPTQVRYVMISPNRGHYMMAFDINPFEIERDLVRGWNIPADPAARESAFTRIIAAAREAGAEDVAVKYEKLLDDAKPGFFKKLFGRSAEVPSSLTVDSLTEQYLIAELGRIEGGLLINGKMTFPGSVHVNGDVVTIVTRNGDKTTNIRVRAPDGSSVSAETVESTLREFVSKNPNAAVDDIVARSRQMGCNIAANAIAGKAAQACALVDVNIVPDVSVPDGDTSAALAREVRGNTVEVVSPTFLPKFESAIGGLQGKGVKIAVLSDGNMWLYIPEGVDVNKEVEQLRFFLEGKGIEIKTRGPATTKIRGEITDSSHLLSRLREEIAVNNPPVVAVQRTSGSTPASVLTQPPPTISTSEFYIHKDHNRLLTPNEIAELRALPPAQQKEALEKILVYNPKSKGSLSRAQIETINSLPPTQKNEIFGALLKPGEPVTDVAWQKLVLARERHAAFHKATPAEIIPGSVVRNDRSILASGELDAAIDSGDEFHTFAITQNEEFFSSSDFTSELSRKSVKEGQISVVVKVNGAGLITPSGSDTAVLSIDAQTLVIRGVEVPATVSDQAAAVVRSGVLGYNERALDPARRAIYERFMARGRLNPSDLDDLSRIIREMPDTSENSFKKLVDELDFNGLDMSDPEVALAADQFLHLETVRRSHIDARDGIKVTSDNGIVNGALLDAELGSPVAPSLIVEVRTGSDGRLKIILPDGLTPAQREAAMDKVTTLVADNPDLSADELAARIEAELPAVCNLGGRALWGLVAAGCVDGVKVEVLDSKSSPSISGDNPPGVTNDETIGSPVLDMEDAPIPAKTPPLTAKGVDADGIPVYHAKGTPVTFYDSKGKSFTGYYQGEDGETILLSFKPNPTSNDKFQFLDKKQLVKAEFKEIGKSAPKPLHQKMKVKITFTNGESKIFTYEGNLAPGKEYFTGQGDAPHVFDEDQLASMVEEGTGIPVVIPSTRAPVPSSVSPYDEAASAAASNPLIEDTFSASKFMHDDVQSWNDEFKVLSWEGTEFKDPKIQRQKINEFLASLTPEQQEELLRDAISKVIPSNRKYYEKKLQSLIEYNQYKSKSPLKKFWLTIVSKNPPKPTFTVLPGYEAQFKAAILKVAPDSEIAKLIKEVQNFDEINPAYQNMVGTNVGKVTDTLPGTDGWPEPNVKLPSTVKSAPPKPISVHEFDGKQYHYDPNTGEWRGEVPVSTDGSADVSSGVRVNRELSDKLNAKRIGVDEGLVRGALDDGIDSLSEGTVISPDRFEKSIMDIVEQVGDTPLTPDKIRELILMRGRAEGMTLQEIARLEQDFDMLYSRASIPTAEVSKFSEILAELDPSFTNVHLFRDGAVLGASDQYYKTVTGADGEVRIIYVSRDTTNGQSSDTSGLWNQAQYSTSSFPEAKQKFFTLFSQKMNSDPDFRAAALDALRYMEAEGLLVPGAKLRFVDTCCTGTINLFLEGVVQHHHPDIEVQSILMSSGIPEMTANLDGFKVEGLVKPVGAAKQVDSTGRPLFKPKISGLKIGDEGNYVTNHYGTRAEAVLGFMDQLVVLEQTQKRVVGKVKLEKLTDSNHAIDLTSETAIASQ